MGVVMLTGYRAYGVAWVPQPYEPVGAFGAAWTGWCPEAACRMPHRLVDGLGSAAAEAVRPVERTGLRIPIVEARPLAHRGAIWQLETGLARVADRFDGFEIGPMQPRREKTRVTLAADPAGHPLDEIAAAVREAMRGLLQETGRGAVAATAPLSGDTDRVTLQRLHRRLAATAHVLPDMPVMVRDLALMGDPGFGRPHRLLWRFPLGRGRPSAGPEILGPKLLTA